MLNFMYGLIAVVISAGLTGMPLKAQMHTSVTTSATNTNSTVTSSAASEHTAKPLPESYNERISDLAKKLKKEGFHIQELLDDPRFEIYEGISDRFRKSAERKSRSLESYKRVLGFDHKSERIVEFINTHSEQLREAESEYGISRYVISAIIGIESDFGINTGNHNPFNAYVSMYAENYRQDFAEAQIRELLEFVERKNIDVFELKSSYAGAMTFAQFIPYSLNKWFVGSDIMDMNNNIRSVANYLAYFVERTGNIETAVLRYNPSSLYTKAVLDLADVAQKRTAAAK